MSSSFMCPNCGIKVSAAEESGCPGCGHIQSESTSSESSFTQKSETKKTDIGQKRDPFKDKDSGLGWIQEFLRNNVLGADAAYQANPKQMLLELEGKCLAAFDQAPNEESKNILNSYLSWINLDMGRFKISYDYAIKGVACSEVFFRNQSFDSIFGSVRELNLNNDYKMWLEKARETNYPELAYQEMQYFMNIGEIEKALERCDEHYAGDPNWGPYNRAYILQQGGRTDEAEIIYRKLTSRKVTELSFPASANSLAFAILMPQRRFLEAEQLLVQTLCTTNMREKINAYSNLAMVAFQMKEFDAATRFANVGASSHELAIASESRLTLVKIQLQRLLDDENTPIDAWDKLLTAVQENLQNADFDDAAALFTTLIATCERSSRKGELVNILESEYQLLTQSIDWGHNATVTMEIEIARVERLSPIFLEEKRYPELEALFTGSMSFLGDHRNDGLIEYLRIPFADVEFRKKCLVISHSTFLAEWASFETHPEIHEELVNNKYEPILLCLAKNPAVADSVLTVITAEKDLDLDFAISTRETLSQEMIELLISSAFETVRREIARRADLTQSQYERLATDEALLVRDAIRENTACSAELKALAALGSL
jgi:tetratricopeptide (TPR) repeat protein